MSSSYQFRAFFFFAILEVFYAIFDSRVILNLFANFFLDLLIVKVAHLCLLEFHIDLFSFERGFCI